MKRVTLLQWGIFLILTTMLLRKLIILSSPALALKPASLVPAPLRSVATSLIRFQRLYNRCFGSPLSRYLLLKRILDVVVSAALLLFLAPLLLVLTLLIRLDSPGGAIFSQQRVGTRVRAANGSKQWELRAFTVYKFRTMRKNASSDLHKQFVQAFIQNDSATMHSIQNGKAADGVFKIVDDPRITRVGKLLRKTSLDELPQLWNVLKGDMTLVGPRPPLPYEVDIYTSRHLRRLEAKPGLTGLWQISARSTVDFEKMVELDIDYIDHPSFWSDLKILLKTPIAVVWGKGAA